jgi:hypothetical protein
LKKRKTKEIVAAEISEVKFLILEFFMSTSGNKLVNMVAMTIETITWGEIPI